MRFPLKAQDLEEIRRYQLRSACCDCFFYVEEERRCAHEWPTEEQEPWPLAGEDGSEPAAVIQLCKEFELK